jgi:predicted acylesterase/phospholipase RssA
MADPRRATDGPNIDAPEAWEPRNLPDWDEDFVDEDDFLAFASVLSAPETSPSEEDLLNPKSRQEPEYITAINDWKPIRQKVRGRQKREHASKKARQNNKRRGKDEAREGWTYGIVKYPFLFGIFAWIAVLGVAYILTRVYIWLYETQIAWRGTKNKLRKRLRQQKNYEDWVKAAQELDRYLGNDRWKEQDEYSFYDSRTIRQVLAQMRRLREKAESEERSMSNGVGGMRPVDELRGLAESCVKNNFCGFENPRLYSETYYGTKNLVQNYVDETARTLRFLLSTKQLAEDERRSLAKYLSANFGRTALCLSGGATFAYYHFGIAKALLDAGLLPDIITGTSGGALVAALLCTRTDDELKQLLVPALAHRIKACSEPVRVWAARMWRTGARFDSVDWAKQCAWFTHGSLTFMEAYRRTGRILNVSCVPSDPHSPTMLVNYLTAPDCVIWSAVLASAAVPGILNPVVLMRKNREGKLEPYSFGHKWKDGSLRTDIPLKSLNLHFNVNFSIVSQVNPHVNFFFFSSRGTVGRPVTHRRGRGWRGGYLGSAIEQFLKLDMNKWLKVLRHLELLPRPMGQDWSEVFLQRFNGTITIWPKTIASDYWYILSDPSMERLARMIHTGQLAAWPKLKFIANRMAIEKVIDEGRQKNRPSAAPLHAPTPEERSLRNVLSEENLQTLLNQARASHAPVEVPAEMLTPVHEPPQLRYPTFHERADSPSFSKRFSGWFTNSPRASTDSVRPAPADLRRERTQTQDRRRGSVMDEIKRQSEVFFDDDPQYLVDDTASETEMEHRDWDATEDEYQEEEGHEGQDVAPFAPSWQEDPDFGTVIRRRQEGSGARGGIPQFELNGEALRRRSEQ